MPTSSPGSDIITFIIGHIGLLIVIVIAFFSWIANAMKGSPRPPSGMAGTTPSSPMAPPTTIPRPTPTARPLVAAPSRPVAQPKFRPPTAPESRLRTYAEGTSSEQLAQERADIERFVQEEKEMEAGEPAALGTPLSSLVTPGSTQNALFAVDGPISGAGANANLLRAILLAQALGPPRSKAGRRQFQAL